MKSIFVIVAMALSMFAQDIRAQNMNRPTDIQVQSFVRTFSASDASENIREMIDSARNRAALIMSTQACYRGYGAYSVLGRYVVAGRDPAIAIGSPTHGLTYHDMNTCLSVERIDNFSAPAKNALSFRTVFISDISGESRIYNYTLVRRSDGEWLIQNANK